MSARFHGRRDRHRPSDTPSTERQRWSTTQASTNDDRACLTALLDDTIARGSKGEAPFSLMEEVRSVLPGVAGTPSLDAARRLCERLASARSARAADPDPRLQPVLRSDQSGRAASARRATPARRRAAGAAAAAREPRGGSAATSRSRQSPPSKLAEAAGQALVVPVFTAHPSEARRRTILEKLDCHLAAARPTGVRAPACPASATSARRHRQPRSKPSGSPTSVRDRAHRARRDPPRPGTGRRHAVRGRAARLPRIGSARCSAASIPDCAERESPAAAPLRLLDRRRPRRQSARHARRDAEAVRLHQETILQALPASRSSSWAGGSAIPTTSLQAGEALRGLARSAIASTLPRRSAELGDRRALSRASAASSPPRFARTLEHVRNAPRRLASDRLVGHRASTRTASELLADLAVIADDLQSGAGAQRRPCWSHDLIRLVEVFGFHMLTLDVRQHSSRHAAALDEIFAWAGVSDRVLEAHAQRAIRLA